MIRKFLYKLTGHRNRYSYWSHSALSNKLQSLAGMKERPVAASMKEWRQLKEHNKGISAIVYWITTDGFDTAQKVVYFPADVYHNVYAKLHNMFISKSHVIETGLEFGEWHEYSERIPAALFHSVVDFVENQKANRNDISFIFADPKPEPIKDRREAGLAYLDWEISLTKDENYFGGNTDHPEFGQPTEQAMGAKEIKEVYLWIKDIRPNRPDPHDVTGWSSYCDSKKYPFEQEEDNQEKVSQMVWAVVDLEQQYDNEDTEMLCRIVKFRNSMWT